jgi:lichenan operon transcriptional antiterminator
MKLLNYLQSQDNWTTASQLSLKLNVSLRSIKNYISEIKETDSNLIISSGKGYKVNKPELQTFLKTTNSLIPQSPDERIDYIIMELVKAKEKFIDIYDLCQEIYVSEATLKSDLHKVKLKCYRFDLTLITSGSNISLEGLEKNKRKIMSSILYAKLSKSPMNINIIKNTFVDYDIKQIKTIIINVFKEYHYFINDYSLENLILHVIIAIDRIKNNYIYEYIDKDIRLLIKNHEYEMAHKIASKLELTYHIKFNENEIKSLISLSIYS